MKIETQINKQRRAKQEIRDIFSLTSHTTVEAEALMDDCIGVIAKHFPRGPRHCREYLMGYVDALSCNVTVFGRAYPESPMEALHAKRASEPVSDKLNVGQAIADFHNAKLERAGYPSQ